MLRTLTLRKQPILKSTGYGVFEDGPRVKLQVGKDILPMTWDVAIRAGARLRVAIRSAQEYVGQSRELSSPTDKKSPDSLAKAIREAGTLIEGGYKIFDHGPDVVWQVGNADLTMTPEVATNISTWLVTSGLKVQQSHFPDMKLQFHVAQLTDGVATERVRQSRQDATAVFAPK